MHINNEYNKNNIKIININNIGTDNNNKNKSKKVLNKKLILKKTKDIMTYNDQEINNLPYKLAIKNDKRSYCQYYLSLLKIKHILIFSFYNNNDYNSRIIKIDLFIINFTIYYTVNALFFNDDTMHKIYEDKGSFNIIYQLPQIIYSSLISSVLNVCLKLLALSEGRILIFKKNKSKKNLDKRETDLNNSLCIQFILYFIISTLFLLFFWYYLSMFGAIYRNTQYHLIKETLISFALSLFYPLLINLIPGLFRIPALSNQEKERIYLYKLSKFLQIF